MYPKLKNKLKKGDILVSAVLLCACAVLSIFSRQSGTAAARITVNGETVFEAVLNDIKETENITLENGVVITVEPGAISFSYSPCAGHDCIKAGRLTRPGQTAVCLPTKTVIKITGKQNKDTPDALT